MNHTMKLVLSLGAVVVVGSAAAYLLTRPTDPPLVEAALARGVEEHWAAMAAHGPRPPGSEGLSRARTYLAREFEALGYRVERSPVTYRSTRSLGGSVVAGARRVEGETAPGAVSAEQEGLLVILGAGQSVHADEAPEVQSRIVLAPCRLAGTRAFVSEVLGAGALGVILSGCGERLPEAVEPTPLPVVLMSEADGAALRAREGEVVRVEADARASDVQGEVLVAARVGSRPEVVFGAGLDGAEGSLRADRGASGALAVLEAARRVARDPLVERSWFVVFEGTEAGAAGARAFVSGHRFPLRQTRALLDLREVGRAAGPLRVAGHDDLLTVAREELPGVRVFRERAPRRESFGREEFHGTGDHAPFVAWGVRTLLLRRSVERAGTARQDERLDPGVVRGAATSAVILARAILARPWQPSVVCDGFDSDACR